MDFSYSEEQLALFDLTKKIVSTDESGEHFHRPTWRSLAQAGLLGIAVDEASGGAGLGLIDLIGVIRESGRAAAGVPVVETLVQGALPIDRFADGDTKTRLLSGVIEGELLLTGAMLEANGADPRAPRTTATEKDGAWHLSGAKIAVSAVEDAHRIVVSADAGLFLLDPGAEGVKLEANLSTSGAPWHTLTMSEAPAALLAEGTDAVRWWVDRSELGQCALLHGLAEEALHMTARYATEREQFGKPIATFQAVSQRIADGYIDLQAMELSLLRAAWLLDAGLPADAEVAIARYWAAEGGFRVTATAQHVHGGIGFDRDYPLHRYTLQAKNAELLLGGATAALAHLGDQLAR